MKYIMYILFGLMVLIGPTNLAAKSVEHKDSSFKTILSNKFDFSEESISGESKTPTGFMLRGRKSKKLSQLVKLRKNFSDELKSSSEGAKVIVK